MTSRIPVRPSRIGAEFQITGPRLNKPGSFTRNVDLEKFLQISWVMWGWQAGRFPASCQPMTLLKPAERLARLAAEVLGRCSRSMADTGGCLPTVRALGLSNQQHD